MPYTSYYPQYTWQYPTYPSYGAQPQVAAPPTYSTTTVPNRMALNGRSINSIDEISPQDVPMDGTRSIFPTYDGESIYVKSWNSDGTIRTERYVREQVPLEQPQSLDYLSGRLLAVEDRLSALERGAQKQQNGYQKPRRDRMNDVSDNTGTAQQS